jgi:predicted  nucleic acid-binding Zn-ribbon protein
MLRNLIRYGGVLVVVFLIVFLMDLRQSDVAPQPSDNQFQVAVKERQGKGEAIAANIARNSIDPILVGGEERDLLLDAMLLSVKEDSPDILYMSVSDKKGVVIANTDAALVGQPYAPPEGAKPLGESTKLTQELQSAELGDYYDSGAGIMVGDSKIGEVHVALKALKKPENAGSNGAGQRSPKLGLVVGFIVGILGIAGLSFMSKGGGAQLAAPVDAEKAEQLKREEGALMKRIAEMRNDEEGQRQKLVKIKTEFADLSTQVQAKRQELAQIGVGATQGTKISEEVNAMREEGAALQRRIQSLKAREASLIQSIQEKRDEEQTLEQKLDQDKAVIRERVGAAEDDSEIAQKIEGKKREELSLTMRIVSKRREEIAISQRVEAKRREELELLRRVEMLKKQVGQGGKPS